MRSLYILTIAGLKYGIWKDDIESVAKVDVIHQIPLSPSHIAGMVMLEKRGTALIDLAVILGHEGIDRAGSGFVFLVAGQEQQTGFIVDKAIIERQENKKDVKKLACFLATQVISSCLVDQDTALPLIDINRVYSAVLAGKIPPHLPAFSISPQEDTPSQPVLESVRIFGAGGEKFAINTSRLTCVPFVKEHIFPLVNAPAYIVGMLPLMGTILPIIDLASRLRLPAVDQLKTLLIAEIAGENFGFLVADDFGEKKQPEFNIMALPNLAVSPWSRDLALVNGELIPILAAAELVKNDQDISRPSLAEMYVPDNKFFADFEHTELKVVEFLLLGARHVLPKIEVTDVVPVAKIRRLPDLESIVIGVVLHNNEIVPVLDLAMVFGRRSIINPDWQMILVTNGNFKAFVVTEEVGREHLIPPDYQKNVPLSLPQRLVYGCYPEGTFVYLILNVQAIAVNFDKVVVLEFIASLTEEMLAAPAEIVPALLPAADVLLLEQNKESVAKDEQEVVANDDTEGIEAVAEAAQVNDDILIDPEPLLLEDTLGDDVGGAEMASIAAEEQACKATQRRKAEEEAARIAEEVLRIATAEEARKVAEKRRIEEEETARIAEEELRIAADEEGRLAEEKIKQEEAVRAEIATEEARQVEEDIAKKEDEQRAALAAEEREAEARAAELRKMIEPETKKQQAEIDPPSLNFDPVNTLDTETQQSSEKNHEAVYLSSTEDIEHIASTVAVPLSPRKKSRSGQKKIRIAVIFCLLVIVLFLGVLPFYLHKKSLSPLQQIKIISPVKVELGRVAIIPALQTDMDESKQQAKTVRPALAPNENITKPLSTSERPPIIVIVPRQTIIKRDSYVVKKGDTLWYISGEMTGDPQNFSKVADENSIPDPNLIFPAQKIIIRKEVVLKK